MFAALQSQWPDVGFDFNWVWLHLSKTYRVEFRNEEEYVEALTLEYEFRGRAFKLVPFNTNYKSYCIKNVDQMYQISDNAIKQAILPYGTTEHIQHGGDWFRSGGRSYFARNGTIWVKVKPTTPTTILPPTIQITHADGQIISYPTTTRDTYHRTYKTEQFGNFQNTDFLVTRRGAVATSLTAKEVQSAHRASTSPKSTPTAEPHETPRTTATVENRSRATKADAARRNSPSKYGDDIPDDDAHKEGAAVSPGFAEEQKRIREALENGSFSNNTTPEQETATIPRAETDAPEQQLCTTDTSSAETTAEHSQEPGLAPVDTKTISPVLFTVDAVADTTGGTTGDTTGDTTMTAVNDGDLTVDDSDIPDGQGHPKQQVSVSSSSGSDSGRLVIGEGDDSDIHSFSDESDVNDGCGMTEVIDGSSNSSNGNNGNVEAPKHSPAVTRQRTAKYPQYTSDVSLFKTC